MCIFKNALSGLYIKHKIFRIFEIMWGISIFINSISKIHKPFKIIQVGEAIQNLSPRIPVVISSLCFCLSAIHLSIHPSIHHASVCSYADSVIYHILYLKTMDAEVRHGLNILALPLWLIGNLGNPMDRGTWWTTEHGVTQSQTCDWTTEQRSWKSHFTFLCLFLEMGTTVVSTLWGSCKD